MSEKHHDHVGIYIVIGLFAWRQVHEARKLREEQARPFVIVDFEPGWLVYLTVENLGRTMARDISIQFDKPLETTLQRPHELDESPLYREPIPTLPPGKKIRVLFDQFPARLDAGLPLTYDVEVRYRGPTSGKPWKDTYKLDLGMYLGSALPPKGIPELVTEVEKIRNEIERWKGSNLRGLLVHTLDQRRQDRIDRRRMQCAPCSSEDRRRSARGCSRRRLDVSGSASPSVKRPASRSQRGALVCLARPYGGVSSSPPSCAPYPISAAISLAW